MEEMLIMRIWLAGFVLLGVLFCSRLTVAEAAERPLHDNFYWLGQINKASIVINSSEGLLSPTEAAQFARGLETVLENGNELGAARPNLVITFEPLLIQAAGEEVTKIHAGRSSQ